MDYSHAHFNHILHKTLPAGRPWEVLAEPWRGSLTQAFGEESNSCLLCADHDNLPKINLNVLTCWNTQQPFIPLPLSRGTLLLVLLLHPCLHLLSHPLPPPFALSSSSPPGSLSGATSVGWVSFPRLQFSTTYYEILLAHTAAKYYPMCFV